MNRKLYLIFFLFFSALCSSAQPTEMVWGDNLKIRGDVHVIGEIEGNLYGVRYSNKGYEFLDVYDLTTMNLISTGRMNMRLGKGKNRLSVLTSMIVGKNILLFAENPVHKDKKKVLYALIMNTDGDVMQDWKQVVEIKSKNRRDLGEFIFKLSPDQSKILIFCKYPYNKEDQEKYKLVVMDKELKVLADELVELPYKDAQTIINSTAIDNNGVVYVSAWVELATKKEKRAAKKAKQDVGKMVLMGFDYTDGQLVDFEFQLDDKTMLSSAITIDSMGKLVVTGFFSDNTNKKSGISGTFYSRFSGSDLSNEVMTTQMFSQKFVSKIVGKRRAEKGVELSVFYRLREVIPTQEGGMVLIAEEYYVTEHCSVNPKTGATNCYLVYHYNDLIVIGTSSSGEILFETLIPKRSSDGSDGYYLSYGVHLEKNKINIIFLDHARNYQKGVRVADDKVRHVNVRRAVATVATISQKGEIEYNVLYDVKKTKIFMRPRESQQVDNRFTFVTGLYKGKSLRIGRINFI